MTVSDSGHPSALIKQSEALSSYLEQLLGEDETVDVSPQAVATLPASKIQKGQNFNAVIADLGAMKIAIPDSAIRAVLDIPDTFAIHSPLEGVLHGEIQYANQGIKVVNCAALLNPDRQIQEQPQCILLLKQGRYALLCYSAVAETEVLAEWVRWREELHSKPWLTATISRLKCALLEPEDLISWLEEAVIRETCTK